MNINDFLEQKLHYWRHKKTLDNIYQKRAHSRNLKSIKEVKEMSERMLSNKNYSVEFRKKVRAQEIHKNNEKMLENLLKISTRKSLFPENQHSSGHRSQSAAERLEKKSTYAINKEKREREINISNNKMALRILDQKPILSTKDIVGQYDKMAGFRIRIQKFKTDEELGSISKMESFATNYARNKGIKLEPISVMSRNSKLGKERSKADLSMDTKDGNEEHLGKTVNNSFM